MVRTLSPAAHAAILRAAERAHPHEACGLLLGAGAEGGDHVHTALPTANVHPDPARHFEIDPAALLAAHKAARSGGPRLIGFFHSHPNGLARPSATDARDAAHDGRVWLIVAKGTITAWKDLPSGFEPLSYSVRDG